MIRIAYISSSPELYGGIRVIFEHVDALNRAPGLKACVLSDKSYPDWLHLRVPFVKVARLEDVDPDRFHAIVVTDFPQLEALKVWKERAKRAIFLHLCQGYEIDLAKYYPQTDKMRRVLERIREFYSLTSFKLIVSEHLRKISRDFRCHLEYVGQHVDGRLFYPAPKRERRWMLIVGNFLQPFKGVDAALRIAREIKERVPGVRVLRVSPVNTLHQEVSTFKNVIDDYLVRVPYHHMPEIYRKSCISIYMAYEEGFGFPVAESLATGTPVVARDIPPFREICGKDYPLVASEKEAVELALELLKHPHLHTHLSKKSREVLRKFHPHKFKIRLYRAVIKALVRGER